MTDITRADLELCAKLIVDNSAAEIHAFIPSGWPAWEVYKWPQDGTYEECVIKAAAAVMRARKKA